RGLALASRAPPSRGGDGGAARSLRPLPRLRPRPRVAVGAGPAAALSGAGAGPAGHAALSAGRGGARGLGRRLGGVRLAARLSPRRSAPPHPLAELGGARQPPREGVSGRVLRAARASARHV